MTRTRALAVASLLVAATGCKNIINPTKVEDSITDTFKERNIIFTKVTCPPDLEAKEGLKFTCDVEAEGHTFVIDVTVNDSSGSINWNLRGGFVPASLSGEITDYLKNQGVPGAVVTCPVGKLITDADRETFTCTVDGAGKKYVANVKSIEKGTKFTFTVTPKGE